MLQNKVSEMFLKLCLKYRSPLNLDMNLWLQNQYKNIRMPSTVTVARHYLGVLSTLLSFLRRVFHMGPTKKYPRPRRPPPTSLFPTRDAPHQIMHKINTATMVI